MKMKNDCQVDYIKEAFDKLYNRVMPYIDLNEFANADRAFKELDKKVHSEIYILKKCLAERDIAVDAGLTRSKVLQERINDLEQRLNNECKHGEDLANINGQLASENADLKAKTSRLILLENSRAAWRSRAQHAEKRVTDLNKKIHDLEEENSSLRVTPPDANAIEVLEKENSELKTRNEALENVISALKRRYEMLYSRIEVLEIAKRPWHGDCNAMTGGQTCCESLAETIEFQGKRIEELEAEKARLKEAYDIHETTIKKHKEDVDLSYGHEFEFGDEVFVPWSCDPYMYIKSGQLYNPRTERLVYVGKDQHLKWFGEKFSIV